MLLTILNLPYNVKYSDIKALVQSKCNVEDLILDNLTPHEKNTKKITIGLSCAEDAAMVMRNINGFYMDGRQLQVINKSKTSDSNVHHRAPVALPSVNPLGAAAQPPRPIIHPPTNWYNSSFPQQPVGGNQLSAPVIPPLMNFGSQTAYYQMNQPTYPTPSTSSTEKVGYPELQSYGSKRNQSDNQNNWSSNNWNQQEFGFPNTEDDKNLKTKWGNNLESNYCESQWDNNPDARWNSSSDTNQDNNRNSEWDGNRKTRWGNDNESKWNTNQQSKGNNSRDVNRDRSPGSEWYSRRGNDRETNRDLYRSSHRRDDQYNAGSARHQDSSYTRKDEKNPRDRRESSFTRNDQINARPHHGFSFKGRDQNNSRSSRHVSSSTRNDRNIVRSSGHDSSSMRNDRNYTRSSRHDSDQNNARFSRRDSPHTKNDQSNTRPGRHDAPYMRNDQNDTRSSSRNIYGDHVNDLVKRDRNDKSRQNETNQCPRPLFDQHQLPPAKRSRFANQDSIQSQPKNTGFKEKSTPYLLRSNSNIVKKNVVPPQGSQGQHVGEVQDSTSLWRKQITRTVTKRTMRHKCCLYEGVKIEQLQQRIIQAVRSRLDTRLQKKKYISAKQMAQIYYSKFNHATHCDLINENVEALGGKMILLKNGPVGNSNVTQQQGPPQNTSARRGGKVNVGQRQIPPLVAPGRGGKVNVGQRQVPPLVAPGRANNQSIPLAQIPGRIPQYPQGDKQIYKKLKRESASMFKDDAFLVNLMSSMPPAIQNAIEEEMEIIHRLIEEACDDPNPGAATFAEKAKYILPEKLESVIKVNLTKRMLPVLPIQMAVFSTPKVHRTQLENYLTAYNICCLKKSKNKPIYIADSNSVEDYDKLCLMGPIQIGESTVTFKPFHLAGGTTKVKKHDIVKQREQFKIMQVRYFDKIFANTPQENCKFEEGVQDVPVNQEIAVDIENKEKQLGEDIKKLHDQIIDPVDVKTENVTDVNTEIPTITQDVQVNDGDFTTDVDIDNFGKEINDSDLPASQFQAKSWTEEVDGNTGNDDLAISEHSKEIKTEDDKDINNGLMKSKDGKDNKAVEEDIDIDDVNEDDLEDW